MDTVTLHEATEKEVMFEFGKLYSLLDLFGGGTATCDNCGRWQRYAALTPDGARERLAGYGWTFVDDKDLCPKCSMTSTT